MESEEGREADQKQKAVSNFDSKDYNEQDKVQMALYATDRWAKGCISQNILDSPHFKVST